MKVPSKNKVQKQKTKKKLKDKDKKEQVLVVAQEFKFARLLSGNEKRTRDRVLKTLKKWLQNCFDKGYEFKEDDFIRVWKGLFYAVWMSDKPLVQEDLCESIAELLDLFPAERLHQALLMTSAGLKVLATEWYGIDQHRMDKFLMLIRRYLRGSLRCLQRCNWSVESCEAFSDMLMGSDGVLCVETPQYARNATSMILHLMDCYLEELAKVSRGELPGAAAASLCRPLTALVCGGGAGGAAAAARRLLTALLRQSEPGLRYEEAARAWRKMGCPAGGPEALELVVSDDDEEDGGDEDCDEEETGAALDPRAGRVDAVLRPLPVPAAALAAQLRAGMRAASSADYRRAAICLKRFEALAAGEYPLAVAAEDARGAERPASAAAPVRAARRLRALEKTLVAQADELALRGLKRKHRKRLLAKSRAGLSIVEEAARAADAPANCTNGGDWQVEETQPKKDTKRKRTDSSNKENEVVKRKANRKRKAQENETEKGKKAKTVNNNIDKGKLSDNGEVINSKYESNKTNAVKSKVVVNDTSNSNKSIVKKDKKTKVVSEKNIINSKTEEKAVRNLAKLIKTHKQTNNNNITPAAKNILNDKGVSKKDLHAEKQAKTVINVATLATNDKKTKRQKVLPMAKIKNYQKQISSDKEASRKKVLEKKVKFVLKNNGMQGTVDYYKSVRQSPSIPFDSSKKPSKTNLKVSTPSPINPFFKKKLRMKF